MTLTFDAQTAPFKPHRPPPAASGLRALLEQPPRPHRPVARS
jgi:hypothetical protein